MLSGLQKRIISTLTLGPLVVGAVYYGGVAFYGLTGLLFVLSLVEWHGLSKRDGRLRAPLMLGGVLYIGVSLYCAVYLRMHEAEGLYLMLYVLFAVWACDMGAFGAGKAIGGPKMAPSISPNKTWAGLLGGCLASVLAVGLLDVLMGQNVGPIDALPVWGHVIIGVLLAVVGQVGDLLVSHFKRRSGLKDTGNLIPGHGGVLDRIDALLLAMPVFALLFEILEDWL